MRGRGCALLVNLDGNGGWDVAQVHGRHEDAVDVDVRMTGESV